jgi:hypothetical protein
MMKLKTWNCQGAFREKANIILADKQDILVIHEFENLDKLLFSPTTVMYKLVISLFALLLNFQRTEAQCIQGKMFEFKATADSGEVKAELFLLQNNKFCIIRYTHKSNKVTGGTYVLSNDSLYLTFKQKIVTLGVRGNFRFYLREKRADLPPVSFLVLNDSKRLEGKLYSVTLPFATRTIGSKEEENRIKALLEYPEWKVLEGKSINEVKNESKENVTKTK